MGRPTLLLLDEPSLGLAPLIFMEIFSVLDRVRAEGVSVLVVEQNIRLALEHAQRAYVFQTGRVVMAGPSDEILNSDMINDAYLGGALAET
jgi:branched-chain amino acid transport system ATP-binding protein